MSDESPRLLEIARRVSEGNDVDWGLQETEATPDGEDHLVRAMREVTRIVEAHRDQQAPEGATASTWAWGSLEILDRVGAGSFGEVFRARDPKLERVVALKLFRPEAASRADEVLSEGRLLARVRHPNVVTVFGADEHDGRVGLWMEFVQGRTLSQVLREQGPFGAREAGLVGLDVCRALAAVHAAGLLHRDIKAQNVMRETGGRIVLMDLGSGVDMAAEVLQGTGGTQSGTPLYMAPELFRGEPASPRSDLYSVGVLLYHLVAGAFPVGARSIDELREKHALGTARPLGELRPDLPAAFVRVVERALATEPRARHASAAAMEQALALALGVESGPVAVATSGIERATSDAAAGPAAATAAREKPGAWHRFAVGVGIAALVFLAALAALRWRTGHESADSRPAGNAAIAPQASVPAAEPAARASGEYTIEAALYRGTGMRERLDPGGVVSVGDALSLDIEASRDLYLYVLDEDDAGEAVLLYPLPGDDPSRPIRGGERRVLPGERGGRAQYWQVTSAGGREHVLVLASPERLPSLERDVRSLTRPAPGRPLQYPRVSDETRVELRGIAGMTGGPSPSSVPRARLFESAPRLGRGPETASRTWIRRLDLENRPGPEAKDARR